jgi:hypothetical protein
MLALGRGGNTSEKINITNDLFLKKVCTAEDESYQVIEVWATEEEETGLPPATNGRTYAFLIVLQGEAVLNNNIVLGPLSVHKVVSKEPHIVKFSPNTRLLTIAIPEKKENPSDASR